MCDYYRDWVEQGFEVERLRTALTDLQGRSMNWQPIDTAPDDGRFILAWVKFPSGEGNWNIIQRDGDDQWIDDAGCELGPYVPSHWVPLPDPPVD